MDNTFENLKLNNNILKGAYSYGFIEPSNIQTKGINIINTNKDCIIQSKSGTGKTGAYLLGVLNKMKSNKVLQGIIITPTRELSTQVFSVAVELSKFTDFKISKCIGGTDTFLNINEVNNTNLIIGTLGRIHSLLISNNISLKYINFIVLDEVDELVVNGINDDLKFILNNVKKAQKILISATITINVFNVGKTFLIDPIKLLLEEEEVIVDLISQFYIDVDNEDQKYEALLDLYNLVSTSQAIIFCNTINTVIWLKEKLEKDNFPIIAIHSSISPSERNTIIENFRNGVTRLLLTTDLLARGIDVPNVNMVINYELPYKKETYIHRIGRCGRFNKKGIAINILLLTDNSNIRFIQKLIHDYNIDIKEMPDVLDTFL